MRYAKDIWDRSIKFRRLAHGWKRRAKQSTKNSGVVHWFLNKIAHCVDPCDKKEHNTNRLYIWLLYAVAMMNTKPTWPSVFVMCWDFSNIWIHCFIWNFHMHKATSSFGILCVSFVPFFSLRFVIVIKFDSNRIVQLTWKRFIQCKSNWTTVLNRCCYCCCFFIDLLADCDGITVHFVANTEKYLKLDFRAISPMVWVFIFIWVSLNNTSAEQSGHRMPLKRCQMDYFKRQEMKPPQISNSNIVFVTLLSTI